MSTQHPPIATSQHTCENCEAVVSAGYVRVFGDQDGTLHHCQHCMPREALYRGAGGTEDYERRTNEPLQDREWRRVSGGRR